MMLTGNTISQVIPFIIAPIISRIFKPEEFAIQANFLAIVGLIGIISAGRYELAVVLPKEDRKAKTVFLLSMIIIPIISLLSYLLFVFKAEISNFYHDPVLPEYMIYVAPAVFFTGLYSLLFNWNVRFRKFNIVSFSRIIQSLSGNLLYVALGYLAWGVKGLIIGWFLGQVLSTLILLIPTLKNWKKEAPISKTEIKEMALLHKDFPMINSLHAFTDIFATQFFIFWLITNNYGMLALGLFSMMNRYLRAPIQLVTGAVSQIYYKEASECANNQTSAIPIIIKTLKICLFFALPFILVVSIWGPQLFSWYLGGQWKEAGEYARIMAPALFVNFIFSPISTTPFIFNKQKLAFIFSLLGYVLSLGSLIFISYLGYSFNIALWAYSICLTLHSIFVGLWYIYLAKKK
ncbi:MAG: lipopolysaccharide biosynthesis protein [Bacteroidales bacterium]